MESSIDHAKHLTYVTYIKFIVVSPVNFVALVRITVWYFVENLLYEVWVCG
jgi:hypothetical protein